MLQSLWRSRTTVLFIDTESGVVTDETKMHNGEPMYSWNVLATDNKTHFACSRSTPTSPSDVLLGYFDQQDNLTLKVLDRPVLSVDSTFKSFLFLAKSHHAIQLRKRSVTSLRQSARVLQQRLSLFSRRRPPRGLTPNLFVSPSHIEGHMQHRRRRSRQSLLH